MFKVRFHHIRFIFVFIMLKGILLNKLYVYFSEVHKYGYVFNIRMYMVIIMYLYNQVI